MNRIDFEDAFVVFHYPKDEGGGVLAVFGKCPPVAVVEDRNTTPEENETIVERLLEIRFRTPQVVENLINRLQEVKAEFNKGA